MSKTWSKGAEGLSCVLRLGNFLLNKLITGIFPLMITRYIPRSLSLEFGECHLLPGANGNVITANNPYNFHGRLRMCSFQASEGSGQLPRGRFDCATRQVVRGIGEKARVLR